MNSRAKAGENHHAPFAATPADQRVAELSQGKGNQ